MSLDRATECRQMIDYLLRLAREGKLKYESLSHSLCCGLSVWITLIDFLCLLLLVMTVVLAVVVG